MNRLVLPLVFVGCVTLATVLDTPMRALRARTHAAPGVMAALLGDSRRMFANEFAAMADAYFHSGFYPTIFDTPEAGEDSHIKGEPEPEETGGAAHEEPDAGFLGKPKDFIERFGRNFFPTVHTHLAQGNVREILPWLQLSVDMDPQRIQSYLIASYWLRKSLKKSDEAEQFLRAGLRANPDSYEILLELGSIYDRDRKNPRVARNLLDLAAQKWQKQEKAGLKPDPHERQFILGELVRVDKEQNDLKQLLADLEALKAISPNTESLEKTIEETRAKLAAPAATH